MRYFSATDLDRAAANPSLLKLSPTQGGGRAWQIAAAVVCAIFGLLFILNVHPIGDGDWFWYAYALRQGQRLYSGLHLPMQPLYVFATEWNQRLLGEGWLASKALAAIQDVLYCWAIYRIARRVPMPALQQALLIMAAFGTSLIAIYYRFDDYHVTGHLLVLFSVDLLLGMEERVERGPVLRAAALLGLFAGLSIGNRLNDGAFLFLASGAALAVFARRGRVAALGIFAATATAVLVTLVLCTGDSLVTWADETIFHAAAIKGGTGSILAGPLRFPISAMALLWSERSEFVGLILTLATAALYVSGRSLRRTRTVHPRLAFAMIAAGALGIAFQMRHPGATSRAVANSLITVTYVLFVALGIQLLLRWRRGAISGWNEREVLFLFPLGQLVAGAMTSGQSPLEAYPVLAMLLLILPFVFPQTTTPTLWRDSFVTLLVILAPGTLVTKWTLPYAWHHYYDKTLFTDRVWYHHPNYGPMYIEREQLAMMQDVCGRIQSNSHATPELLSMPWPYANYFCSIQPWRGFVQTWYDTSSKATIQKLVADLETHPPEWIVYERGLDTLAVHEKVFLHGGKLPHRKVDALVGERLRSGAWSLPWQHCYNGADWLLIHTQPAAPGEPNDTVLPSTDAVNLCARTVHGYLP